MRTVLVVEDEDDVRVLYELVLNGAVRLIRATSVEEALRLFRANPGVACIAMDGCVIANGRMPILGGPPNTVALVKEIRKTYGGLMIAASVEPENWWTLVEAGCNREYKVEKYCVPNLVLEVLGLSAA